MTHPGHATSLPVPPAQAPLLHPGGVPIVGCTDAEYAASSTSGDRYIDLIGQFKRLAPVGEPLALRLGPVNPSPRYTATSSNASGRDNHFQGIQRLPHPGLVVVCGGDPHTPMAHLFLGALPSRGAADLWGSNLLPDKLPPDGDTLVRRIDLNATLWHPGGMAILGDILALALENSDAGGSRIELLNWRDPTRPSTLDSPIVRPGVKAGAVGLTRLADGHFLAAVWSDSEKTAPNKHLDLYRSNDPTLLHTTWTLTGCTTTEVSAISKFQTIALLRDTAADGTDRDLYLLGFANHAKLTPNPDGPNLAELFRVELEVAGTTGGVRLTPVHQKLFSCREKFSDMAGATGVHRTPGGALVVYCGHHFIMRAAKRQMLMRFEEYRPGFATLDDSTVTSIPESSVELFDAPGLAGPPLLLSAGLLEVPDLDQAMVGVETGAHRPSSLRVRLPLGFALVLYRGKKLGGNKPLGIRGTGATVEIDDLAVHGFDNLARSCSVVALGVAEKTSGLVWVNPP
jgi:hypothetical protein